MSNSSRSTPLRLRIRPSRPLAAEPFLLPVLGGGQSSLSDLAEQIASALTTHGASASTSSENADSVTGGQLALYLDGFRLLDWRYRVRDTLRDGDVLSVYHVSKLPVTITIDSSDDEVQRTKSKSRSTKRKRKYRSSSEDSDPSSSSSSSSHGPSCRARSSKKTRRTGPIRIKQEKVSNSIEPPRPSSDHHIQAEADRIALLIKSEIGPSASSSSSRPTPSSRQAAQADDDDDLPKPPSGLAGMFPARPASHLPMPGPSSTGAAAAMQAFEARMREQAKAKVAEAEESSDDDDSSQEDSSKADDSDSSDSDDDSSDDDSDSADSSSSLAQVEDLVARQPSVGNEAKKSSPRLSAQTPAVPHQIASDVKDASSSSSESSSSVSDSSDEDDSDSDGSSDNDSVSADDSDPDSDSQCSSSSASSSSGSDSSESVHSQTRRPATPPGGWVPPGQGSSRTRQKNLKNRQKAKEKQITQRKVDLLAAQQRVAEDSVRSQPGALESSTVKVAEKAAANEASQAPQSPVLSSAHSDSSSASGWVLDTAPTIPHTPYQARFVAGPPTGIPQQILYQTQTPSSSSASTAPHTLSEREAQIAALREKIEKAEEARRLAHLQRQQSQQSAQTSDSALPSSFNPVILPGTLPPGAGALDVDFTAAESEADIETEAEAEQAKRAATVTSQQPVIDAPSVAVAESSVAASEAMAAAKKPSGFPASATSDGTSPSTVKENSKTRRLQRRLASQLQQEQQQKQAGGLDKEQQPESSAAWSTPGSSYAPAPAPNPSSRPSHEIPSNIRLSSVDCRAWSQGCKPEDYLYIPSGQEAKFPHHRQSDNGDDAGVLDGVTDSGPITSAATDEDADEYADDPTQDEQTRQYLAMQRNVKAQLKRDKELERLKEAARSTHMQQVNEELKRRDETLERLRQAARLSHAAKARKQQQQQQQQEQAQQAPTFASAGANGTNQSDLLHPDLPLEFKSFNTRVGGVESHTPASEPAANGQGANGNGPTLNNGKSTTVGASQSPPAGPKNGKRSTKKNKKHLDQTADATSGIVLDYGDEDEDETYAEQRRKRAAAAAARKQQKQKQMDAGGSTSGGGVMPTSVQV